MLRPMKSADLIIVMALAAGFFASQYGSRAWGMGLSAFARVKAVTRFHAEQILARLEAAGEELAAESPGTAIPSEPVAGSEPVPAAEPAAAQIEPSDRIVLQFSSLSTAGFPAFPGCRSHCIP
jgi:hypothetical protein